MITTRISLYTKLGYTYNPNIRRMYVSVTDIDQLPPIKHIRFISPLHRREWSHRFIDQVALSDMYHEMVFEKTGPGRKYRPVSGRSDEGDCFFPASRIHPCNIYLTVDNCYRDQLLLYKLLAEA